MVAGTAFGQFWSDFDGILTYELVLTSRTRLLRHFRSVDGPEVAKNAENAEKRSKNRQSI
jgi:hypothetical protein